MLEDGGEEDGGGVDSSSFRYLALCWYESPMKRLQFSGKGWVGITVTLTVE